MAAWPHSAADSRANGLCLGHLLWRMEGVCRAIEHEYRHKVNYMFLNHMAEFTLFLGNTFLMISQCVLNKKLTSFFKKCFLFFDITEFTEKFCAKLSSAQKHGPKLRTGTFDSIKSHP